MLHARAHPLGQAPGVPAPAALVAVVGHEYGAPVPPVPDAAPEGLVESAEGLDLVPLVAGEELLVLPPHAVVVLLLEVHLHVLDVGEGDADADDGAGVVVGKVQPLAHLPAAHGDEEGAVHAAVAPALLLVVGGLDDVAKVPYAGLELVREPRLLDHHLPLGEPGPDAGLLPPLAQAVEHGVGGEEEEDAVRDGLAHLRHRKADLVLEVEGAGVLVGRVQPAPMGPVRQRADPDLTFQQGLIKKQLASK